MTLFLMSSTVIFTVLLFDTVRISASDTEPIQYNELKRIKLELTEIIKALPSIDAKLFGYNFIYHALIHVKLSHNLTAGDLVKNSYHKWSKKMLVYILLSKHTKSMRIPMWAFCLYTYKMESGQIIESAYEETYELLRSTLAKICPMFYDEYLAKVIDENLQMADNVKASHVFFMKEEIPAIKKLAETFADNISIDRLLLSNVLEDSKFSEIFIDKFGLVPSDGSFNIYLARDNTMMINMKTTFQDRLYQLLDVYYRLIVMLKIMMLRFCSYHLRHVKYVECKGCVRVHRSQCNSKISGNLKKFAQLLWLSDDDPLMPLIEQFNSETNGESDTIEKLQTDVIKELNNICDLWNLNEGYRETISMNLPTFEEILSDVEIIIEIADSAGIDMKTKCTNCENVLVCHGIELTNLYADVFVGFLEKTLTVNGYFLYDDLLVLDS